ncbi:hypothetical protein FOA52_000655 [Chlamydomonas sp. UWO 241]|nr:hypothetical protein FOA52_000655 [Chlamydomonas sp. UWO 241]
MHGEPASDLASALALWPHLERLAADCGDDSVAVISAAPLSKLRALVLARKGVEDSKEWSAPPLSHTAAAGLEELCMTSHRFCVLSIEALKRVEAEDVLEEGLGFPLFKEGEDKLGWLMTTSQSCMEDKDDGQLISSVDCFFMCQDGSMFKARVPFTPYFYIQVANNHESDVESWLRRMCEGSIRDIEVVYKEDLDLKNHLSGLKRRLLKVNFFNLQQLMEVRKEVQPIVARNRAKAKTTGAVTDLARAQANADAEAAADMRVPLQDVLDSIVDIREYDVPYHIRFQVDTDVRCAHWFTVSLVDGIPRLERRADLLQRAEPRICAWDIECTKLPLQFPNAEYDQVFMISYMLDRQGYLIVNREVVGEHISDFEYTPKPEFEGPFTIFNEPDELSLLRRFLDHMREAKPAIYVTYNGDFFDFPFMEKRCARHGIDLHAEMGFKCAGRDGTGEWLSRHAVHMDCLHWVNRDSYLPQGSRGLKAVTKAKLGYDPVEVDPEDMLRMAAEHAQQMASYSVSDAVSTYYLYMTYIHPFVFSLATIIPMPPDEVLRKGSGTLCEQLLIVEAYQKGIVCPNKHTSAPEVMYNGHLLESETYIGGKVEAIESGVFRADLPMRFKCKPDAYQGLLDKLDRDLQYAITNEAKMKLEDITNYDEVRATIAKDLEGLRDTPNREETPLIYHLDVAAMYPNIILTNRLQPSAIVEDEDCAACDFNRPGKTCLRQMEWIWRGEHFASSTSEYNQIKSQLQSESFPPLEEGGDTRYWEDLEYEERQKAVKDRLKKYTQKVYKRVLDKPITQAREAGICQRENSMYVDTVRAFRDRRYEYKGLNKMWKGKLDAARKAGDALGISKAFDMVVLYDSLQLAHKCILNSFYGYVMRKGARWYSMEMAGVVTYTGAKIIQRACELVEQLGRPLELDTDGIWCALPGSFPEEFKFKNVNGKDFKMSYPGVMLNVMCADHNTNDQYQTLVDPVTHRYETSSEMSIEFEVDGPYKAMILPASKEEGKTIKKRYAVFNFDGSLAELKGFELKRRGELKLVKVFQAEVFEKFLAGSTLEECYHAVAAVANRWLDMLDTRGRDLTDEELIEHISEATMMSKSMEEYEGRKSCAVTCAKRLGQFLGDEHVKEKGLCCTYVIAKRPENQSTTERAIPVTIFQAEPAVARSYLRKWCGDLGHKGQGEVPDVRDIVDWEYYKERLGSAIQKIITIPAAMQAIANPVPRVKHPDWLHKKITAMNDKCQQLTLGQTLARVKAKQAAAKEAAAAAGGADGDDDAPDGPDGDADADAADDGGAGGSGGAEGGDGMEFGDMEDLGVGGAARRAAGSVHVHARALTTVRGGGGGGSGAPSVRPGGKGGKGKENSAGGAGAVAAGAAANTTEPAAPLGPKPKLQEDYAGWVRFQKTKWRSARAERKRRRGEQEKDAARAARNGGGAVVVAEGGDGGGNHAAAGPADRTSVRAMLQQRAARVTAVPWQLLQLAPTSTPGRFKMWFLAEERLQSVHVAVPRTLYIDSEVPAGQLSLLGSAPLPMVAKVPPGGRRPEQLHEAVLPETEYMSQFARLSAALSAEHVRAVYEDAMPLEMHAALQLGCVVKVAPGSQSKSLAADWQLSDFLPKTVVDVPYLEESGPDGLGPLRYVALYSSADASGARCVVGCVMPASKRGLLVVVQPSAAAAQEVSPAMIERAWRESVADQSAPVAEGDAPLALSSAVEFAVEYVQEPLDAARLVQRQLSSWQNSSRAPLVVSVQAPLPAARMQAQGLSLLADFPCVDIPPHSDDSRYPALQWQAKAAKRAAIRMAQAGPWLRERAGMCRYAQVPLSDLGGDTAVAVADVMLARSLREAQHVLWVRDPSLPDLGVEEKEEADAESLVVMDIGRGGGVGSSSAAGASQVHAPGAYRSICVELRLHHLAVNAVSKATQLSELEGSTGLEASGATPAFSVLKKLLDGWLTDAGARSNPIADHLLQHFYRWVSSPSSRLHHASLQRTVAALMGKLFAQLVAELGRLGATIVSANFNSIRLCTGKRNVKAAVGYIEYLLEALRRRELFHWLHLEPVRWWHALLFRDQYNYCGVEAAVPTGLVDMAPAGEDDGVVVGSQQEGGGGDEPTISCFWSLKDYLPVALQEPLNLLMSEFVYLPWKQAMAAAAAAAAEASEGGGGGASQGGSQAAADSSAAEEAQAAFLTGSLMTRFTERLLEMVTDVLRKVPQGSELPDHRFPRLAGSYLTAEELGSPALAFTRTVCHLLALDARVSEQVSVLRRQLLKLLHVREFGPQAEFREMCHGFTLPDVICSFCNDCRDLDLCRDDELARHSWNCRVCGHAHEQAAIEGRLVTALRAAVREYELQDLVCSRCKQVVAGHLRAGCGLCSGELRLSLPADMFRKRLVVFHNIAVFHGFEFSYVFLKGEGNKGASYKYTWKPDWKLPPGVKPLSVAAGVAFWLSLAAIPIFVLPAFRAPPTEEQLAAKKPNPYAQIKERNREERMKWIQKPDMPPRLPCGTASATSTGLSPWPAAVTRVSARRRVPPVPRVGIHDSHVEDDLDEMQQRLGEDEEAHRLAHALTSRERREARERIHHHHHPSNHHYHGHAHSHTPGSHSSSSSSSARHAHQWGSGREGAAAAGASSSSSHDRLHLPGSSRKEASSTSSSSSSRDGGGAVDRHLSYDRDARWWMASEPVDMSLDLDARSSSSSDEERSDSDDDDLVEGRPAFAGSSAPPAGWASCPVVSMSSRADPVDVMQALRQHLGSGAAVLALSDARAPGLLLNSLAILHLLNQDLRLEEDFQNSVLFQPIFRASGGRSAMSLLVWRAAAPELQSQLPSAVLNPEALGSDSSFSSSSSLASYSPSSSSYSEVWDVARAVERKLDEHALIQMRCLTPRGTGVALRALRRARKELLRGGNGNDLLVSPHITTDAGVPTIVLSVLRVHTESDGEVSVGGQQKSRRV